MQWRPISFALGGVIMLATAIDRYSSSATGFTLIVPALTAVFSLLAALLTWEEPRPRA